jgi:hypothetical protein
MQKDGIFVPSKARAPRGAAKSAKEELRIALDMMNRGELGKAYLHLEAIALDKEPPDTVAAIREKMKAIGAIAWSSLKEAQTLESIGETVDALKAYQDLVKEFPTLPAATEAKQKIDALKAASKK